MRHVLDRPRARAGLRLSRFAGIERRLKAQPAREIVSLRRAPKGLNGALRLKRYLRIARAGA